MRWTLRCIMCSVGFLLIPNERKTNLHFKTAALTSKPKNYSLAYYKDIFDKGDSISSSS